MADAELRLADAAAGDSRSDHSRADDDADDAAPSASASASASRAGSGDDGEVDVKVEEREAKPPPGDAGAQEPESALVDTPSAHHRRYAYSFKFWVDHLALPGVWVGSAWSEVRKRWRKRRAEAHARGLEHPEKPSWFTWALQPVRSLLAPAGDDADLNGSIFNVCEPAARTPPAAPSPFALAPHPPRAPAR